MAFSNESGLWQLGSGNSFEGRVPSPGAANLKLAGKQVGLDWWPYRHTVSHIVKTTLVLPDDLLMEAKTLAVRRKTTLKAIIEAALRREIRPATELENPDPSRFEVGPFGILRLRKPSNSPSTTVAHVRAVQEALETEEVQRLTGPQRR